MNTPTVRVLGVPSTEQRELIADAQIMQVCKEIDLAQEHEVIRTREARAFKMQRESRKDQDISVDLETTIIRTLNTLRETEPKVSAAIHNIEGRMRRQGKLPDTYAPLRCPVIEMAGLQTRC